MSSCSTLGEVIRARRRQLGWTQEDLAERVSAEGEYVRQSEISRIEGGKIALPRRDRLERIATALDLPLGELLARSGWSGADVYFQHPTNGHDADVAGESRPVAFAALDQIAPAHERSRPIDQAIHESPRVSNQGAVAELRRALATAREESVRLLRNRERSLEIAEQLGHTLVGSDARSVGDHADGPAS